MCNVGVATSFDATALVHVVAELCELGLSEHEIAMIMDGNARRFLRTALPR